MTLDADDLSLGEEIDLSPEEEAALDATWDRIDKLWAQEEAAGIRNADGTLTAKGGRYYRRKQRRTRRVK